MSITRIPPAEAAERLANGSVYLDVRSVREFAAGHPEGAINIPLLDHNPMGRMAPNPRFLDVVTATLDRNSAIITACAMGGRSVRAAGLLLEAGYTDVVDMLGGMGGQRGPMGDLLQAGWTQSGLPVTTGGRTYEAVLAQLDE